MSLNHYNYTIRAKKKELWAILSRNSIKMIAFIRQIFILVVRRSLMNPSPLCVCGIFQSESLLINYI